mmetsp:Transcript_92954/g.161544  ORF Transcript_92954/g.161544 Transcript_92954/m.161544 type:complete len:252 (+) Transcript_92954:105-860(+)
MSFRCPSSNSPIKSVAWSLCALLLVQDAGVVQALGRSPMLPSGRSPNGAQSPTPLKSELGLGFHAPTSEDGSNFPSNPFGSCDVTDMKDCGWRGITQSMCETKGCCWVHVPAGPTCVHPGTTAVSHASTYQHDQRQSQIWTIFMCVVLIFWLLQAVKHGLKSMQKPSDERLQISVQVLSEPLQTSTRPTAYSKQMQCLISELESSVYDSTARLPQGLLKEKKAVMEEAPSAIIIDTGREASGLYLDIVGDS